MGFLKSIGMWLLKILLSGVGVKVRDAETSKLEKEKEQALAREQAHTENDQLEDAIRVKLDLLKEGVKAEAAKRIDADPFGIGAWNAEAKPVEPAK